MTISPTYPPETYSSLEQERITEFRSRIADLELTEEIQEEAHLIRWLRARNLDVGKAYEMLKNSLEWRKENKVDGILEREDVPEDVKRLAPYASLGLDKDGYPILLVPMGRQDGRTMLERYGLDECFRFNLITCEKIVNMLRKRSKEQGRQVTQIVEIIDLEGYNYRQLTSKLCRDFMIKMQTTFDAIYPEMLRYCLVINAPKIFYILFNLMKPFIPKQTLEKVDIYGPEPEKWKKVIAERFPLECIPEHWGGTRKGSDEYCSKDDTIWLQGPVPITFFNPNKSDSDDEDGNSTLSKINVGARDSLKININVTNPNSSIAWRFRTENHDIGFQILDGGGNELLAHRRAPSQKHIHEGTVECKKMGIHTVIFDNSYSFTRSKTIFYNVSVIGDDAEDEVEKISPNNIGKPVKSPTHEFKELALENNNSQELVTLSGTSLTVA